VATTAVRCGLARHPAASPQRQTASGLSPKSTRSYCTPGCENAVENHTSTHKVSEPYPVMYWFAGGGGGEPVLAKALLAISEHFTLLNTLVWDKVDPGLGWRWRRSWEAIIEASNGQPKGWYGGTEKRNVLRYAKAIPQADDHPTPKPVPLLEELIRAAAPFRGLILDPFAGSGPTVIAAERTGRTCLAVELEPRYCDIVLARWEALAGSEPVRVS